MIFDLWLEGHFRAAIANRLNEQNIPSPSMRKRQLGVKRTSWSKRRDEVPWTEAAVRTILQNGCAIIGVNQQALVAQAVTLI